MSTKKQEIVDSWEEIDEERLVGAITILKNDTHSESEKADLKPTPSGISSRQNTLPQMLEEELRPKMIPQRMQILKRPQNNAGSDGRNSADSKPKTMIKSLDQRKQEYAEARLRILGSAHDEEETDTKKTPPATNGYRVNNVNNNNPSGNGGSSANVGGGGNTGDSGMAGNGANNNSNMFRYHPSYRPQPPIGTFPSPLQNGPPRGQPAGGMFYPTLPQHHPHHPMHNAHPMHQPPQPFPHMAHPHHPQQQQQQQSPQQQQQQQHMQHQYGGNGPYQQHFAPHLNHQSAGHLYAGGRNGVTSPGGTNGYFTGKGYGDGMGPLLGHAPPGALGNHTIPYGNAGNAGNAGLFGRPNSHGSPASSSIINNQHVLRLPAGPDGSQGFNMRR